MEFFKVIERHTTETELQKSLTLANLDKMTNLLFVTGESDAQKAEIGGMWGEFTLTRMEIKGGIRMVLNECPNALSWTITTGYPPAPEAIVIHLTLNRKEKDTEFLEEVDEFLSDLGACLANFF